MADIGDKGGLCPICGLPDTDFVKVGQPNCIIRGGDRCYRRGFERLLKREKQQASAPVVRVFLCERCWKAAGCPPPERLDTAGCASCAPGTIMACRLVRVAILHTGGSAR